ncbi:MAG: DUF1997 domain-containing protein [Leptolyngbya sp. SIO4C1]|nr:DUF1997 domain-containing protein [Leptolyngbya sp. SIO4C1]
MPSAPLPIESYLMQRDRLVYALMDERQVDVLDTDLFRFRLQPLKFIMLTLKPVADIRVQNQQSGIVVWAEDCYLADNAALSKRFSLTLQGTLQPQTLETETKLNGQADLQVKVDLPAALKLTPRGLLEATGNGILNGILLTMKQRLMQRLIADYQSWAAQELEMSSARA